MVVLFASRRTRTCFSCRRSGSPIPINWTAYGDAWKAQDFTRYFLNTAFVAIAITVGNLLLASLAGYSLSKFRYFGRGSSSF